MTRAEYEQKKAELERQLEELEKEEIIEKRWKPSQNQTYFCVDEFGGAGAHSYNDDESDDWAYLTNNCFKTRKEAEEYKRKLETYYKFKKYVEEHNDEIDWENRKQEKWCISFDYSNKKIRFSCILYVKEQGIIYATSQQILEDAIKYVGEDNVKKYILEVE